MTQQPYPYAPPPPLHPQAITVLVLGILGLVLCQVLAPLAWLMGNRVVREVRASNGATGGLSEATIGRVLGIVGTILLVVVIGLGVIALGVVGLGVVRQGM